MTSAMQEIIMGNKFPNVDPPWQFLILCKPTIKRYQKEISFAK
jgi:hypothetical protein